MPEQTAVAPDPQHLRETLPRSGHLHENTPSQRDTHVRIPRQLRPTSDSIIPDAAPLLAYISGTRHHFLQCGSRRPVPTEAPFAYGPAARRVRSEHPGTCGTNIHWCPWPLIRPPGCPGRPPAPSGTSRWGKTPAGFRPRCTRGATRLGFCPTAKSATDKPDPHINHPGRKSPEGDGASTGRPRKVMERQWGREG